MKDIPEPASHEIHDGGFEFIIDIIDYKPCRRFYVF